MEILLKTVDASLEQLSKLTFEAPANSCYEEDAQTGVASRCTEVWLYTRTQHV